MLVAMKIATSTLTSSECSEVLITSISKSIMYCLLTDSVSSVGFIMSLSSLNKEASILH